MRKPHILITAGPTREYIDPVRVITNLSEGRMGYEIAREALKRRFRVTLISGPVSIKAPSGVKFIYAETAALMKKAVLKEFKKADCLIMAAAVSDFRAKEISPGKIKKRNRLTLKLKASPDILKSLPPKKKRIVAGFALESEDLIANAKKKMKEKGMDLVIANSVSGKTSPFGQGKKTAAIIEKGKKPYFIKNASKARIAGAVLDTIKNIMI